MYSSRKTSILITIILMLFILINVVPSMAAQEGKNDANLTLEQTKGIKTPFKDLSTNDPNTLFITYIFQRGIIKGFPDGTYHPQGALTRAETAAIICKAAGLQTPAVNSNPFKDLPANHWAAPQVAAAVKAGYIKGFPDGTYQPEAMLSRAQGITLLMKLCTQKDKAPLPVLQDMDTKHWAAPDMGTALALEMIGRSADGKNVYPESQMSRGSLARALAILLTKDPGRNQAKLTGTIEEIQGEVSLSRNDQTETLKSDTNIYEGDIIKTGQDSKARIVYPDGSGTLIEENSEIVIKKSDGRSYIKQDGTAGIAVEFLNIDLKKGTLFGALATKREAVKEEKTENNQVQTGKKDNPIYTNNKPELLAGLSAREYIAAAASPTNSQDIPWYESAKTKKVKVKVDMPWGIAAVRGTFIKVTVNTDQSCNVSCLTGSAEVSSSSGSGGSSVPLGGGQSSGINGQGSSPVQAASMSQQDKQDFSKAQDWVVNTALNMDVNQEAKIVPAVVIAVEIPNAKSGEQQVQEKTAEQNSEAKTQPNKTEQQQATEQVETAVKSVLDALKASGIELKQEVIENLKQQVQEIQTHLEKQTADALQMQVTQAQISTSSTTSTTSRSSNSNSSSSNIQSITYTAAGTYGPVDIANSETINGNVIIAAAGVTLQNMNITGSLTLAEGIGEGDVTLNKLRVQGNTSINGGGSASIHIIDCQLSTVTVDKKNHQIRIVVHGNTNIGSLTLNSGAILEESELSGTATGFSSVIAGSDIPARVQIILYGSFARLDINAAALNIQLNRGSIDELNITPTAAGTNINLASGTAIQTLTANVAAIISGAGHIASASINAAGVQMAQLPASIHFTAGISAAIAGQIVNDRILSSSTGAIGGWVTNSSGQGLQGASITAQAGNSSSSPVSTIEGGSFLITGLSPGNYILEVTPPTTGTNYSAAIINNLTVTAGSITVISPNIQLEATSPPIISNNAKLNSLSLTDIGSNVINLTPAFNPDTLNYSASVAESVYSINVIPSVADLGAAIKVNGNSLSSGNAALVNLSNGSNTVEIEVTAPDANTFQTYSINIIKVLSSLLSPLTCSFDKNPSAHADVIITLTLNGNNLLGLTNGPTTLVKDTDYTVSGNIVTIKKEYLANQTTGTTTLTFNFNAGVSQSLNIEVRNSSPTPPVASNNTKLNSLTLTDIGSNVINLTPAFNPDILSYRAGVAESVYSINVIPSVAEPGSILKVNGNSLSSGNAALVNLSNGSNTVEIEVTAPDANTRQTYTIDIFKVLNSLVSPTACSFDKNPSAQADVIITLTLNGNTLLGITNGPATLVKDTDYTLSGNIVTIKKEYLVNQTIGIHTLTFNFNGEASQSMNIEISNSIPGTISTIAGNGIRGYYGDGGAATDAQLKSPREVAIDINGNIYIADGYNHCIRKVDTSGIISTVVGNGTSGYSGDGGDATAAQLDYPRGVVFDSNGNMYIADSNNQRIRKVDTAGIISTVAGNGTSGYSGDGGDATATQLDFPTGVAFDSSGNMYIADSINHRVRKVDTAGKISTVAGNGTSGYSGDGGDATAAQLYNPTGVAFDSNGNMYITDNANYRIRKVDTAGKISTVAGNGTSGYSGDGGDATAAQLSNPIGVAFDSNENMYIADFSNHCVRKVDTAGKISTVAGNGTAGYSGDRGAATNAQINGPTGLTFDSRGNMYIADWIDNRIRKVLNILDMSPLVYQGIAVSNYNKTITLAFSEALVNNTIDADALKSAVTLAVDGINFQMLNADDTVNISGTNLVINIASALTGVNNRIRVAASCLKDIEGNCLVSGVETGYLGINSFIDPTISSFDKNPSTQADVMITLTLNGNTFIGITNGPATLVKDTDYTVSGNIVTIKKEYLVNQTIGTTTLIFNFNAGVSQTLDIEVINNTQATISTVAGNGTGGYSGDGGAATSAQLYTPYGVAFDSGGNMYIADQNNHLIRKVDTLGNICTVAGNGTFGYSGDGGQATAAQLYHPTGVAFDSHGNMYIADRANNRIRKVDASGNISTVAGNGMEGYFGDGVTADTAPLYCPMGVAFDSSGNMYITDVGNRRIRKVDGFGMISTVAGNGTEGYSGDGDNATSAQLYWPRGVAFDSSGNMYIAEEGNQRIRKVDTSGIINTVAGNGTAGYSGDGGAATFAQLYNPTGVAFDSSGNMYIADGANNCIRKVDTAGIISTVAGNGAEGYSGDGGAATAAQLKWPTGVTFGSSGDMYITDGGNHCIRKVLIIPDMSPPVYQGVTVSNDSKNVTLTFNEALFNNTSDAATLKVSVTIATDGVNYQALAAGDTVSISGANLVINLAGALTGGNNRIKVAASSLKDTKGNSLVDSVETGCLVINSLDPTACSFDKNPSAQADVIITTALNGSTLSDISNNTMKLVQNTDYIISGNIVTIKKVYLANQATGTTTLTFIFNGEASQTMNIEISNSTPGTISTIAGNGIRGYLGDGGEASAAQMNNPYGVATDNNGNVYIADCANHCIRKIDIFGKISTVAGNGTFGYSGDGGNAIAAQLYGPVGVAFDSNGNMYIADYYNYRIRKVDISGIISTVAGNGTAGYSGDGGAATDVQLNGPSGVAPDGSGNLYISDQYNHRIRKVDTSGKISTIAGNGTWGYSGDGENATLSQFYYPTGVAFDSSGNMYIADFNNHRIRKVDTAGIITTVAGNGTGGCLGDGGDATAAQLNNPRGIAFDSSGNMYIADCGNHRIRKVDTVGKITTVAGNGASGYTGDGGDATAARLYHPNGVAFDSGGNMYIADSFNNRIRKVLKIPDISPPVYQGVTVSNDNKNVTLTFNEALVNNTSDAAALKAAVTLAADGVNYQALSADDTVNISGTNLVISLASALNGGNNRIKVAASSLIDTEGNCLVDEVETSTINIITATSEHQTLTFTTLPTTGLFLLSLDGYTTLIPADINATITAANIQAALEALTNVGSGNVTVSNSGNTFDIRFVGALANTNVAQVVFVEGNQGLNGGTIGVTTVDGSAPSTEVVNITTGGATGGSFALTYNSNTTPSISYNATASDIQNALIAADPSLSGNITVASGGPGDYTVTYTNAKAYSNQPNMMMNSASLIGGAPAINIAQGVNPVNETQTINLGGATQGYYTLSYNGSDIAVLSYNATDAQIETTLIAIDSNLSGNISVSGGVVTYSNTLAHTNVPNMIVESVPAYNGAGAATATVTGA